MDSYTSILNSPDTPNTKFNLIVLVFLYMKDNDRTSFPS
jgi:hypothetical protein